MSGISSNLYPFKASLSRGNRKKSGGLRSDEYGRWSICTKPFFARNCLTILAVKPINVPASDRQSSDVAQGDNTFFSSLNSG